MKMILTILMILILGILFYQDLKERKISLWILVIGIIIGGIIHYLHQYLMVFLWNIFINTAFIMLLFGVLWSYAKLKMKKKIFDVFGLGDLLFFILLAVSLPMLSFLIVFIFSLLFSLITFILLKNTFTDKTVPLAGLQSLFFGLVLMGNTAFSSINLYAL